MHEWTCWCANCSRADRPWRDALHVLDRAQRRWHRTPRRCRVMDTARALATWTDCMTVSCACVSPRSLTLRVWHLSRLQAIPSARTATTACASSSRFGAVCSSCRSFRPAGRVPVRSRSACMLMQGNAVVVPATARRQQCGNSNSANHAKQEITTFAKPCSAQLGSIDFCHPGTAADPPARAGATTPLLPLGTLPHAMTAVAGSFKINGDEVYAIKIDRDGAPQVACVLAYIALRSLLVDEWRDWPLQASSRTASRS